MLILLCQSLDFSEDLPLLLLELSPFLFYLADSSVDSSFVLASQFFGSELWCRVTHFSDEILIISSEFLKEII
jgi:hypothetical protein